jgi:rod shape-determining protein MreB
MAILLRTFLAPDLAVDLGSSTTRIASVCGRFTLEAPSMVGETRALRGGVVVEPECAAEILRPLFAQARRFSLGRPRVVATVPTDANREERLALEESVRRAGAAAVSLAPEPLAAAIGAGLDLGLPYAQLVVDIGHGVTDCIVVRSGQIIESRARRVGCGDLEEALVRHRAGKRGRGRKGKALTTEAAREMLIEKGLALAKALSPADESILGFVESFVREVPDDVGAELVESGIDLTGGGALLPGLADALARRTGLRVRRFPDPLRAVVQGGRRMIRSVAEQGAWG